MGAKYQALKGMEDLLPGEVEKWQWLERKARIFFESRGFKEIRTPLLEPTELFVRSVGEASDIVHKQMFSFEDRGERNISLRPEMTASVARAVIEHGLLKTNKSLRLYYLGPMFRAERPQAGRKRQFHQIGVEIINEPAEDADFETISLLEGFFQDVGLKNFKIYINDLGDTESQKKFKKQLYEFFSKQKAKLCSDCQYRLEKNVLRIFDCKNDSCVALQVQSVWDTEDPSEEFERLRENLQVRGIEVHPKRRLVRGLDYYNGTVFEVTVEGLGAQDAVAAGGRYDNLYSDLGGSPTPCTGFSIGVERSLSALEAGDSPLSKRLKEDFVYFAPLTKKNSSDDNLEINGLIVKAMTELQQLGVRVIAGKHFLSLADHLKTANKLGVKHVVIAGSDELTVKKWTVKDMFHNAQEKIDFTKLFNHLRGEPSV